MANTLKSYVPALGTDFANADLGGKGAAGSPSYLEVLSNNGTAQYVFASNAGGLRVSQTVPTSDTSGSAIGVAITAGSVVLASLDTGISPSHVVKYAGTITWSGSGASLATTVTGVAATDIVVASFLVAPTQAAYITKIVPTLNTITITLSTANTGNDAQVSYVVYRAAV